MNNYSVKLNHWCTPTTVNARDTQDAWSKALELYPTCDCCDEITQVEWVKVLA